MPLVRADQLREGDLIDLQDDPYADRNHDNQSFKFELAEVLGSELEVPTCLRLDLVDDGAFGMPPGHIVDLQLVDVEGAKLIPIAHSDYPHEPGRLYECPGCESRCWCDSDPGTTKCIYTGEHRWAHPRDKA